MFDDPNVVYTFHFYGSEEFAYQQSGLTRNQDINYDMKYPSDIKPYHDFHFQKPGQGEDH